MQNELRFKIREIIESQLPPVFDFSEPGKHGLQAQKTLYNLRSMGEGPPAERINSKLMLERSSFLDWHFQRGTLSRGRKRKSV